MPFMGQIMTSSRSFIPLAAFAMVVCIVWLNARQKQARIQARAEWNKQLLDKFASSQELVAFLGQEGSERFLDEMWSEKRQGPKERILGIIIPGCIITSIGIGFLWLGRRLHCLLPESGYLRPELACSLPPPSRTGSRRHGG